VRDKLLVCFLVSLLVGISLYQPVIAQKQDAELSQTMVAGYLLGALPVGIVSALCFGICCYCCIPGVVGWMICYALLCPSALCLECSRGGGFFAACGRLVSDLCVIWLTPGLVEGISGALCGLILGEILGIVPGIMGAFVMPLLVYTSILPILGTLIKPAIALCGKACG